MSFSEKQRRGMLRAVRGRERVRGGSTWEGGRGREGAGGCEGVQYVGGRVREGGCEVCGRIYKNMYIFLRNLQKYVHLFSIQSTQALAKPLWLKGGAHSR